MANENSTCFMSGDSRVNANPFVTIMYTMFLRSHNQIARKLLRMNPKWNDNQLFHVTKAINVAIYQKFIYNDWANAVLGKRLALEIRSKNNDHDGKKYKSDKVSNEFGSAAIRFYNTMLPGDLLSHQDDPNRILSQSTENIIEAVGTVNTKRRKLLKLQDSFYKPRNLNKDHLLDQLTNAILWQNSMAMDNSYVDDLSLQLFRSRGYNNKIFGGDQLAFDIQRTRDHGLQPYINYIKKCLNIRITSWDDLTSLIAEDDLNKLRSIYSSVQDVDLIVGALSEMPNENATVGPTISCILSESTSRCVHWTSTQCCTMDFLAFSHMCSTNWPQTLKSPGFSHGKDARNISTQPKGCLRKCNLHSISFNRCHKTHGQPKFSFSRNCVTSGAVLH